MRKPTYNRKTRIEYRCFKIDVYEYGYGDNKYCIKKTTIKDSYSKPFTYQNRIKFMSYEAIIDDIYITIPNEWKTEVITTETFII